jgi:Zn-dependent protease with chaperone function
VLIVLLASGLALLVLPGAARRPGRALRQEEWSRLCLAAIAGGAIVVEIALLLYAAPTVATASHVPMVEALCRRMLGELTPGGAAAGWAAAVAGLMVPALGGWGWAKARRDARAVRVERCLGRHVRRGAHELVVLPTAQLVAVAVPGDVRSSERGQIVVSEGLVDTLEPAELDAVIRHEAAHLRHGHHRFLVVAAAVDHAFAWLPPARRSTATLRVALERWADDDASTGNGGRGVLRRALLAVTASLVVETSVAAFSAAETIVERLDALDADAPTPGRLTHLVLYCPGVALGAVAVGAMAGWASGAEAIVAMAGQCMH